MNSLSSSLAVCVAFFDFDLHLISRFKFLPSKLLSELLDFLGGGVFAEDLDWLDLVSYCHYKLSSFILFGLSAIGTIGSTRTVRSKMKILASDQLKIDRCSGISKPAVHRLI